MWKQSAAIGVILALAGVIGAEAQLIDDRANETVRERRRPEYDPQGIFLGRFVGRPDFRVGLRYEDNIFARDGNTNEDLIVNVLGAGELQSDWRRHEVAAFYTADYDYYTDNVDESNLDVTVGIRGRLDIARNTSVEGRFSFTNGFDRRVAADAVIGIQALVDEVRNSFGDDVAGADAAEAVIRDIEQDGVFANSPINFNVWRTGLTARHTFDQLRLIGTFDASLFVYFNEASDQLFDIQEFTDQVLADNGQGGLGSFQSAPGIVDQSFRDRVQYRASGRAEYQFAPSTFGLVEVIYKDNNYDVDDPRLDRSSDGFEVLTGFGFDLTQVLRGEASLKYFDESFVTGFGDTGRALFIDVGFDPDDPNNANLDIDNTSNGFGANIDLTWLVSTLTNVSLEADRQVTATSLNDASRFVATSANVTVDHELDRNIILYGELGFFLEEFEGIDREDTRFEYGLGLLYLLNNRYSLEMNVARTEQESSGFAGRDFDINRVFAGLQVRF